MQLAHRFGFEAFAMTLAELEQLLSDEVGISGCRIVVRQMCGWPAARASLYDVAGRRWVVRGGLARKDEQHGWIVYARFRSHESDLMRLLHLAIVHGSNEWSTL